MDTQYPDFMIDLETTGTDPRYGAVIQIAAVRFNYHEESVDTSSMFDRCLTIAPGRFWDESTRDWWHKPDKIKVLRQIQMRAEDPYTVLKDFQQWAGTAPSQPHRFWGKPTHFDHSFISSYFNQFGMFNPFHYRYARDMNSFMAGMRGSPEAPNVEGEIEFVGDVHNGLHDALHQIKMLFHVKNGGRA